jgi:hypothetical protein
VWHSGEPGNVYWAAARRGLRVWPPGPATYSSLAPPNQMPVAVHQSICAWPIWPEVLPTATASGWRLFAGLGSRLAPGLWHWSGVLLAVGAMLPATTKGAAQRPCWRREALAVVVAVIGASCRCPRRSDGAPAAEPRRALGQPSRAGLLVWSFARPCWPVASGGTPAARAATRHRLATPPRARCDWWAQFARGGRPRASEGGGVNRSGSAVCQPRTPQSASPRRSCIDGKDIG